MKPHKHAELIKKWADGAEIEYRYPKDNGDLSLWKDLTQCVFHKWYEYRLKAEPKPDFFTYTKAEETFIYQQENSKKLDSNLKLIWDGLTGKLKDAVVLA